MIKSAESFFPCMILTILSQQNYQIYQTEEDDHWITGKTPDLEQKDVSQLNSWVRLSNSRELQHPVLHTWVYGKF